MKWVNSSHGMIKMQQIENMFCYNFLICLFFFFKKQQIFVLALAIKLQNEFFKKIYPLKKTFIFSTKSMMLLFYLFSIFSFVLAMLYFCLKYMFVILCLRKLLNLFANQKHFPSLTPPQRSMRIDYVPQLETFLFQVPSTNQVDALVFYWKITS